MRNLSLTRMPGQTEVMEEMDKLRVCCRQLLVSISQAQAHAV